MPIRALSMVPCDIHGSIRVLFSPSGWCRCKRNPSMGANMKGAGWRLELNRVGPLYEGL